MPGKVSRSTDRGSSRQSSQCRRGSKTKDGVVLSQCRRDWRNSSGPCNESLNKRSTPFGPRMRRLDASGRHLGHLTKILKLQQQRLMDAERLQSMQQETSEVRGDSPVISRPRRRGARGHWSRRGATRRPGRAEIQVTCQEGRLRMAGTACDSLKSPRCAARKQS